MTTSNNHIKNLCRNLRKNQTDTEKLLWHHLRNRKMANCKFRRQHSIGPYIVDFVTVSQKIVIELDGSQHIENSIQDKKRTEFLEAQGFKVLRFWNNEVLCETESVLQKIYELLAVEE